MSVWIILGTLAAAQVIGLCTILRTNANAKKIIKNNRRYRSNNTNNKKVWEELGLTEEEYNNTRSLVYSIKSSNVSLYTPTLDDESTSIITINTDSQNDSSTEVELGINDSESEALKELLGTENDKDIEEIQKQIDVNQQSEKKQPQHFNMDNIKTEVDIFEGKEINNYISPKEDLQRVMDELKEEESKKAPIGEGEQLLNELLKTMNGEENEKSPILFSEEKEEINPFLYNEAQENPAQEKSKAKQRIALQLAELADECEGTKNMEKIISLVAELYELEGKEEDMKLLKEEYKEYFSDEEEISVRVYEEDIIRVGKEEAEQEFDVPGKYLWMASNQIADGVKGKQSWVGKCIGKGDGANKNFMHFRDKSQRIWIKVEEDEIMKIELGDILTVFVNRLDDSVVANSIQHIKKVAV